MARAGTATPALDAQALTKSYGHHRGVVEVDLQVAPGEVVGLVGANGAGKTTFMRTLLDFIRPTSGSVSVFGLDSVRDSVEVRRRTTYLPGDLVLPPRLHVHDALRRYTLARPPLDMRGVHALAERLDLDVSRRVGDLSKGNKQKVGLLVAFAPAADLLVLDEPTSGLDPLQQREFAALVAERTAQGTTVLLSSHVMSEVEQIASRVALLREGRLAAFEDMAAIHARSKRRGRARPVVAADVEPIAAALRRTEHVTDVRIDDGVVGFACTGDVDPLLKTLAGFAIAALDLTHADLEDAFFSAYGGEPA